MTDQIAGPEIALILFKISALYKSFTYLVIWNSWSWISMRKNRSSEIWRIDSGAIEIIIRCRW